MNEIIYLLATENKENTIGDPLKKLVRRQRFANKLSVGQNEVYQAAAIGFKPELKFEIWIIDYDREMYLQYEDRNYKIIRTYERKAEEKIELTCISVANKEVEAYGNTKSN